MNYPFKISISKTDELELQFCKYGCCNKEAENAKNMGRSL